MVEGEEVAVSYSPRDAKKKRMEIKIHTLFMIIGSSRMEDTRGKRLKMSNRFAKLEGKLKFGFVREISYINLWFTRESLFEQCI